MLLKEYVAIVTCLEEETKRTTGLKEEEPENMERVLPCLLKKRIEESNFESCIS